MKLPEKLLMPKSWRGVFGLEYQSPGFYIEDTLNEH